MKTSYCVYMLLLCLVFLIGCHAHRDTPVPVGNPTVTIKDVVIEEFDEEAGVISVRYGEQEKPTQLLNIPLAEDVRVVASHILPGSVNHLPFRWEYVKNLQGKTVSVRLEVAAAGLSVSSIASGSD